MNIDVAAELQVVSGNPTPEELAAVISVLQAMSAELAGIEHAVVEPPSLWSERQRPIRTPIVPGHTRWSSFR